MAMKTLQVFCRLLGMMVMACALPALALEPGEEKVYVAVEGEGKVAVYDAVTRQRIRSIDLALDHDGSRVVPSPHNVQVAPDGRTVWVTANQGGRQGHSASQAHDAEHAGMERGVPETPADEVVVIDSGTDTVVQRIPLAPGLHLAHVVLTPDSAHAYVTAQNEGAIYKINARTYQLEGKIQTPAGSQPHGLSVAPDGSRAYVALLGGRGMGVLNLSSGVFESHPLDGAPVQTAVTPDGRLALATLYDRKQVVVYDTANQAIRTIDLLGNARGPVQIYPTPDSRYAYVADQGHYFDQPDSEWVYKVDLQQARTIWAIRAGGAPHGIAISRDGRHAYITNLVSDDLSVIDLETDREVARLPVGDQPNGVSLWNKHSGGMP